MASANKINLISLKAKNDQICSVILNNRNPVNQISLSKIQEINLTENFQNISVVGYRAREIAKNLQINDFLDRDDTSITDLLDASSETLDPSKYIAKPFYLNIGNTNFFTHQGPKILD